MVSAKPNGSTYLADLRMLRGCTRPAEVSPLWPNDERRTAGIHREIEPKLREALTVGRPFGAGLKRDARSAPA